MSTKTLRKRIALVAVTALGAGLLSVVAVPSANASAGTISNTTGSIGLLSGSSIVAGTTTTHTATLLSTGTLSLTFGAASTAVVSAGARITGASTVANISGDQASAANVTSAVFTPTGAAGSTFTVSVYSETSLATLTTPDHLMTVTIAGSSVAGVVNPAESGVFWHTSAADVSADTVGASSNTTPLGKLFLDIDLADAYGAPITAPTGALVVTASTGANAFIGTSGVTTSGTFGTAVSGVDPSTLYAVISEATAGAGWSGTVTVTYNGVLVATKTGSITGYATTITTTRNKVATAGGGTTADAVRFKAADAAGNPVVITASSLTMKSSSNTAVVSNVVGVDAQVITAGSTADGKATVTCGTPGTSSVVMQYITPAGKTITSAPLTVICGGSASTYTASFDKASYAQGELAKLTVSFKDSLGAPAATDSAVTALTGGTPNISNEIIVAPMMTLVGTISSAVLKVNADGNLVYTYSVGAATGITPGAYQASVSFPTVNSAKGAAQAVAYTVNAGAGVSNADVLKAIVSLIASINKQIAALQKALLRR
jgi:trimeric autotransporter adhesin